MLTTNFEYSEKELLMFKMLGFDKAFVQRISPIPMIRIAIEAAFMNRSESPAANSLREVNRALSGNPRIYRGTPEYESLIQLS